MDTDDLTSTTADPLLAPAAAPANDADVIVIGAGLAGLRCAGLLGAAGVRCLVLEGSDDIGGRVRTDIVDGFLLDRGFQVLATAYPEANEALDMARLVLRPFYPGALVWADGRFHLAADPSRRLLDAIRHARAPIGSLRDKVRLLQLTAKFNAPEIAQLWDLPDITAAQALSEAGFGEPMTTRFLRPFLGGVFGDLELGTSARMMAFVWRMMAAGPVAVPEHGMGAIARQLGARLPRGSVVLESPVAAIAADVPGDAATTVRVTLRSRDVLTARAVVVATDELSVARLFDLPAPPPGRGLTCLYFDAPEPPIAAPVLALDGAGTGPVTNLAVMSSVSSAYAPPGRALVSATVIGVPAEDDAALEASVRAQLRDWFGPAVAEWRHLRTDRIPNALPDASPGRHVPPVRPHAVGAGLFVAGEHRTNGSIDGALLSGRLAAEAVLAAL